MSEISLSVNVFNHTGEELELEHKHLEHGKWIDKPESIENDHEGHFAASNGKSHRIDGHVSWRSERTNNDFIITFDKPLHGTTRFAVDCSDRFRYTISGDPLEQHAHVSVSFYRQEFENPMVTS